MPRLSGRDYLRNYNALRSELLGGGSAPVRLEAHEQWVLYGYYRPHERHSAADCMEYPREISRLNRPVPQQAGRAFARWLEIRAAMEAVARQTRQQPPETPRRRPGASDFSLALKVRAEVDAERLARILIDIAKYQVEQTKRAREGSEADAPICTDRDVRVSTEP